MIRFLQLSDIHFMAKAEEMDPFAQMRQDLIEDVEDFVANIGRFDYLLICGDLASKGATEEYDKAKAFIDTICKAAKISQDCVMCVPGNHDVDRNCYPICRSAIRERIMADGYDYESFFENVCDNEQKMLEILLYPFREYFKYVNAYNCLSEIGFCVITECDIKKTDKLYWARDLGELNGLRIVMHGINSVMLSDKHDRSGKPDEKSHLQLLPKMGYHIINRRDCFNILMMHHPIDEFKDAKALGANLDKIYGLQLFGHLHKQSSQGKESVKIYSGALQPPKDEKGYFPEYNIIELDVNGVEKQPYEREVIVKISAQKWDNEKFVPFDEESKCYSIIKKIKKEWVQVKAKEPDQKQEVKDQAMDTDNQMPKSEIKYRFLRLPKVKDIMKALGGEEFWNTNFPDDVNRALFLRKLEQDGKLESLIPYLKTESHD